MDTAVRVESAGGADRHFARVNLVDLEADLEPAQIAQDHERSGAGVPVLARVEAAEQDRAAGRGGDVAPGEVRFRERQPGPRGLRANSRHRPVLGARAAPDLLE